MAARRSATAYTVTSSPGGKTAICPGSPCTVTGLTGGTLYTFTVHATNGTGNSAESGASAPVTVVSAPDAPSGRDRDGYRDHDRAGLQHAQRWWFSRTTGYEYSIDNGATWLTLPANTSGTQVTGTVSGLTPGTGYSVLVRAVNGIGTGAAAPAVSATTLPATPAAPVAVAGRASVTVTWTQSSTASVTGYTVSAVPGPATCTTTSAADTSCVIGATTGVAYTYTVVANSRAGASAASAASNEVTATAPVVPDSAPVIARHHADHEPRGADRGHPGLAGSP